MAPFGDRVLFAAQRRPSTTKRLLRAGFLSYALTLMCIAPREALAAGHKGPSPGHERSHASRARHHAIEQIVVTARRRDEAAQDVPLALSVHRGEDLEVAGAWSLGRLQRLDASVHVIGFNPRTTNISIRGLGGNGGLASDGLEGGVGVFLDGVYLGRVGPALFELVDLERVEILRGPQGTLFGRNTTAGAINLASRAPALDDSEAIIEASTGDYGFRQVRAAVSGPLWRDRLAGRLSISDTHRDGFIENVRTGEWLQDFANRGVRGQLLAAPAAGLQIRLIGDYAKQRMACCTVVGIGVFDELDDGSPLPNGFLSRTERLGYEPLRGLPFPGGCPCPGVVWFRRRGATMVFPAGHAAPGQRDRDGGQWFRD